MLQDSSGRDTTMLFGFARDLLRLRKQNSACETLSSSLAMIDHACLTHLSLTPSIF
jgi:hypothetical protein